MQSDTNNTDTKYDRYINIQNTADKKKNHIRPDRTTANTDI